MLEGVVGIIDPELKSSVDQAEFEVSMNDLNALDIIVITIKLLFRLVILPVWPKISFLKKCVTKEKTMGIITIKQQMMSLHRLLCTGFH